MKYKLLIAFVACLTVLFYWWFFTGGLDYLANLNKQQSYIECSKIGTTTIPTNIPGLNVNVNCGK